VGRGREGVRACREDTGMGGKTPAQNWKFDPLPKLPMEFNAPAWLARVSLVHLDVAGRCAIALMCT